MEVIEIARENLNTHPGRTELKGLGDRRLRFYRHVYMLAFINSMRMFPNSGLRY